jgi:hypothetical protein
VSAAPPDELSQRQIAWRWMHVAGERCEAIGPWCLAVGHERRCRPSVPEPACDETNGVSSTETDERRCLSCGSFAHYSAECAL